MRSLRSRRACGCEASVHCRGEWIGCDVGRGMLWLEVAVSVSILRTGRECADMVLSILSVMVSVCTTRALSVACK